MKHTVLIFHILLLANFSSAQNSTFHQSFFQAPWKFHNEFGHTLIIDKGLFGLIDSMGVVICKPQFDWIREFNGEYAIVGLNGKEGIIHKSGKLVVPPAYDDVQDFRNNWAVGRIRHQVFYIDTNGKEMQGPQPNLHDFRQGPKRKVGKGTIRYVDVHGKVMIDNAYTRGDPFVNGYTIVGKGKEQYLIDTAGRRVQEFDHDFVIAMPEGAYVMTWNNKKKGIVDYQGNELIPCEYDEIEPSVDGIIKVKKDYKWGAYNWEFEQIIPVAYDRIDYADYYHNSRNKKVVVTNGQSKGLIDFQGDVIRECRYDNIIIHDDLTMITVLHARQPNESSKYEILDKNGFPLMDVTYTFAKQVHQNYFMIIDTAGRQKTNKPRVQHFGLRSDFHQAPIRSSLIDVNTGKIIFEGYTDYYYVRDGVFACRDTNRIRCAYEREPRRSPENRTSLGPEPLGSHRFVFDQCADAFVWKLLDIDGNEISFPKKLFITDAGPYGLQVCKKVIGKDKYVFGMTDFEGNIIIPVKYDHINHFYGSSFRIKKDGLYGIANAVSKTAGYCKYDVITNELRLSGLLLVQAKGKVGYIDALGEEVIPCVYDSRRGDFRNGKVYFKRGNKTVYLDKKGAKVGE